MSSDSGLEADYANWTPEELMRDYRGEIKRDIFVRCMEWYSNGEVEAKINANRTDGKKIQNPNFYAEIKRNIENIALREGHLPTEYRLQWDKRRVVNLEARFGGDSVNVRMMRQSIATREAVAVPILSKFPSPEELEAARPENGKKLQKGHETKEYWYKFLAGVEAHGAEVMRSTYEMGECTFRDELQKARRIVRRLDEIAEIEAKGEVIPQTFFPSTPLQPGQKIHVFVAPEKKNVVVLKIVAARLKEIAAKAAANDTSTKSKSTPKPKAESKAKVNKKATPKSNAKSKGNANEKDKGTPKIKGSPPTATPVSSNDRPARKPTNKLLFPHMKLTLAFLRKQLLAQPENLPSLASIAGRFDHPLLCDDQTYQEREKFESCETRYSIEKWWTWCDVKGNTIVKHNGKARIAGYLANCIDLWQTQVWYEEQAGAEALGESFLTYTMGRLENLEGIDEEIEDALRSYDEAAWECQLKEPIEKSCLDV